MNTIRLRRIVFFGWQGMSRNFWLSLIAIITLALTVMSVSVFSVLNIALNETRKKVEEQLDVSIFIRDEAAEADVLAFTKLLNERADAKEVIYVDKVKAEEEFRQRNESEEELLSILGELDNPFLRYIKIQATTPAALADINDYVSQESFGSIVDDTSYLRTREQISAFINFSKFVLKNSLVISAFFGLVSIIVVFNVIRLAIFSRRTEIEIMRYVGAAHQLIRLPFVVEGALMGIIAATIALSLLYALSVWEATQIPLYFPGATWNPLTLYRNYFNPLFWSNMLFGLLLGATISFLAVRRYLREQ